MNSIRPATVFKTVAGPMLLDPFNQSFSLPPVSQISMYPTLLSENMPAHL